MLQSQDDKSGASTHVRINPLSLYGHDNNGGENKMQEIFNLTTLARVIFISHFTDDI